MFELRAWIQFTYCRSLYQDNVSKRKAVIRESVSLYPSKISKRLAYFIFKPDHRISGLPHWKNTAGQIKSRLSLLKSSKTFWETLSLLFIMFVQDCVSCAIKHLSGYSNKIWNSWMCIAKSADTTSVKFCLHWRFYKLTMIINEIATAVHPWDIDSFIQLKKTTATTLFSNTLTLEQLLSQWGWWWLTKRTQFCCKKGSTINQSVIHVASKSSSKPASVTRVG